MNCSILLKTNSNFLNSSSQSASLSKISPPPRLFRTASPQSSTRKTRALQIGLLGTKEHKTSHIRVTFFSQRVDHDTNGQEIRMYTWCNARSFQNSIQISQIFLTISVSQSKIFTLPRVSSTLFSTSQLLLDFHTLAPKA